MRTTVTLDEDVARRLVRLQEERKVKFKTILNETLRRGLDCSEQRTPRGARQRTRAHDVGRCLLPNVDDVSEVLAIAEGDSHR